MSKPISLDDLSFYIRVRRVAFEEEVRTEATRITFEEVDAVVRADANKNFREVAEDSKSYPHDEKDHMRYGMTIPVRHLLGFSALIEPDKLRLDHYALGNVREFHGDDVTRLYNHALKRVNEEYDNIMEHLPF